MQNCDSDFPCEDLIAEFRYYTRSRTINYRSNITALYDDCVQSSAIQPFPNDGKNRGRRNTNNTFII